MLQTTTTNIRTTINDNDAAVKALKIEHEMSNCINTDGQMLMLTFPDPTLNIDIVKSFSPSIHSVDFRVSPMPRYCFVQLNKAADAKQINENLSKIHFGTGTIVCKHLNMIEKPTLVRFLLKHFIFCVIFYFFFFLDET